MAYKLYTDINSDLPFSYTDAHDVLMLPVMLNLENKEYSLTNDNKSEDYLDPHWFYEKMRAGATPKTAQINPSVFTEAFTPQLEAGYDILYLAFSSGLSGIYEGAVVAQNTLAEQYPERTICVVDTRCACLGQGLIVHLAVTQRDQGMDIKELASYVEDIKLRIHHWVTVDDLVYLKRGGRVSGASAFLGTMLSIKPIINVDDEGHLIPKEKQQGRKRALKALVDHMQENCLNPSAYPVFIGHADAAADCNLVIKMIKDRLGVDVHLTNMIGPIVGTHAGPGTIALFFVGDKPRG